MTHETLAASLVDNTTTIVNNSKISVSPNYLQNVYPIGSVYINTTNPTNPSSLFGFGTWARIGQGRVLVGEGTGTDINTNSETFAAGSTGGEYDHQLTVAELASHTHTLALGDNNNDFSSPASASNGAVVLPTGATQSSGSDQPHNNIQPYLTVYMWQRTA